MTTTRTMIAIAGLALAAGCGSIGTPQEAVGPPTVVFADVDECRTATGAQACGVVMCDFVPEGKTLDEVCGANFQEGVQATSPDTEDPSTFLVDQLATCAITTVSRDGSNTSPMRDRWVRDDGITMTVAGSNPDVEAALATAVDACATRDDR